MFTATPLLWLTNLVFGLIEGILALRLILKMFGASTVAPFVQWVYETSQPLLNPFEGMFPSAKLPGSPYVIEVSTVIAILIYAFISYLVTELLLYIGERRTVVTTDRVRGRRRKYVEEEEA